MPAIIVGLLFLAWIPVSMLLSGWAAFMLWNWFIPPVFPGAPELTIGTAIGLSLVVSAISSKSYAKAEGTTLIAGSLLTPLLLVFVGWIVQGIVF